LKIGSYLAMYRITDKDKAAFSRYSLFVGIAN
jgi:hypothetical protein